MFRVRDAKFSITIEVRLKYGTKCILRTKSKGRSKAVVAIRENSPVKHEPDVSFTHAKINPRTPRMFPYSGNSTLKTITGEE